MRVTRQPKTNKREHTCKPPRLKDPISVAGGQAEKERDNRQMSQWKEAIGEAPGELLVGANADPLHAFLNHIGVIRGLQLERDYSGPRCFDKACYTVSFLRCGYMKGGLPERGAALPIRMVISSEPSRWNDGSSAFSLGSLDWGGRASAMWGSAPTPCGERQRGVSIHVRNRRSQA